MTDPAELQKELQAIKQEFAALKAGSSHNQQWINKNASAGRVWSSHNR